MKYYSTNKQAPIADLHKAVVKGLAEDRGLYMPERIKKLPQEFFDNIEKMSFQEIAYTVANAFFGEDVDADALHDIVYDTLSFDCPVVKVKDNIYTLELFHGPTLAFKDVGARFMARLLQYFIRQERKGANLDKSQEVNVLVATSGDTGSAVANGFLGVEGIHVYVLYPKGKVSPIQECQEHHRHRGGWRLRRLPGAGEERVHGCRTEQSHEAHLCQFHQRGTFPAPGLLLFQCVFAHESTRQGRQPRDVCTFWQLWKHLRSSFRT